MSVRWMPGLSMAACSTTRPSIWSSKPSAISELRVKCFGALSTSSRTREPLGSPERVRPGNTEPPGWLEGVWASVADVKGSHAILHDLERFREMNLHIAEVGAIAAGQLEQVNKEIDNVLAGVVDMSADARDAWTVDEEAIKGVKDKMIEAARSFLGAEFPTYSRLKALAAGRRLADEIAIRFVFPPNSSHSSFLRAAIGAWGRSRVEWVNPDPGRLLEMLGPVDVPYRERRLFLLLQGVNNLYRRISIGEPAPVRADLDLLKRRAWDLLDQLRDIPQKAVCDVDHDVVAFLDKEALKKALLEIRRNSPMNMRMPSPACSRLTERRCRCAWVTAAFHCGRLTKKSPPVGT